MGKPSAGIGRMPTRTPSSLTCSPPSKRSCSRHRARSPVRIRSSWPISPVYSRATSSRSSGACRTSISGTATSVRTRAGGASKRASRAGDAGTGRSAPTDAHNADVCTPAATTTVRPGRKPPDVSTPTTSRPRRRSRTTLAPRITSAPRSVAPRTRASVTPTASTTPSLVLCRALAGVRSRGSSSATSPGADQALVRSQLPVFARRVEGQGSRPPHRHVHLALEAPVVREDDATQRGARIRRSPPLGPPIQAKESPVTPVAGNDWSTRVTSAPA